MSDQIIGLHHWFDSPPGRYLLAWEQARFDEAVANIFGYHSLQLGMPLLDGLRANRMPHQWLAMGQEAVEGSIAFVETGGVDGPLQRRVVDLLTEPVALPFPAASLDLLVLPHTLELSIDPHAALREVERVLVPEGRVVISGLNPTSLWGLRQRRARPVLAVIVQRCVPRTGWSVLAGWTLWVKDGGPFWAPRISWWPSNGCMACVCWSLPGAPTASVRRAPCPSPTGRHNAGGVLRGPPHRQPGTSLEPIRIRLPGRSIRGAATIHHIVRNRV